MNGHDDYPEEMSPIALDDPGIDALLRGESPVTDPELAGVSAFVREMRVCAAAPAPAPSPALAALLRDGTRAQGGPATPMAPARRPPRAAVAGWRRRLAVAGVGLGAAVTGMVGAGAAGLLPPPVARVVGGVVKALTPLELPSRPADRDRNPSQPAPGPGSDLRRPGGEEPGPSGGQTRPGEPGAAPGAQGSAPASGPASAPPGRGTPTGQGTTPGSGVTVPGIAPPSTLPPVPAPTTPATLPGVPPLPKPTVPADGQLPAVPPASLPSPSTTVPRLSG